MSKSRYKIADIARELNIKKSIVREWQRAFKLSPEPNGYHAQDLETFKEIKTLVRDEGLSIDQAKHKLTIPATRYVEENKPKQAEDNAHEAAPQKPEPEPHKPRDMSPAPKKPMTMVARPMEKIDVKQLPKPQPRELPEHVRHQLRDLKQQLLDLKELLA